MQRKRFILKHPVEISGNSLLGYPAKIRIEPTKKPGWWVRIGNEDVELSPELLGIGHRHLMLQKGSWKAHIVEHFLALRFLGIDNVCIVFTNKKPLMPFYGTGMGFFYVLYDALVEDGFLRNYMPRDTISLKSPNENTFLIFEPRSDGKLEVEVTIDYGKDHHIGTGRFRLEVSPDTFIQIASSRGLGHIHVLKRVLPILRPFGWPHSNEWLWRGDLSPQEMARSLAQHRIWDILGALAVTVPAGGLPTGLIRSRLASHTTDKQLVSDISMIGWERSDQIPVLHAQG